MVMKNFKFLAALLMVLSSAALAGCGDDDAGSSTTTGLTCGTGTVADADNKTCVLDGTATGKTCGAGTVAQGTECVADGTGPIECGAGTVEQNGECVPDGTPITCGTGTTEQNGQCVPDGDVLTCGTGTVDNGAGQCVPESSFTCGNGTIADPADPNTCVRVCPDGTLANANGGCDVDLDVVCSVGTFKFEGKCLSYEEFVREEAAEVVASGDTETAQDDPFIYAFNTTFDDNLGVDIVTTSPRFAGGTATTFTLPAEGSTTLLEGDIALFPSSINGDVFPDQDWDVFAFNGTAGQVIQLGAASEGLPSPYVEVLHFEGVSASGDITTELADFAAFGEAQDFTRLAPLGQGLDVSRKVLLPKDGLYFIRITDGGFTPPSFYVCDEIDEIQFGCIEGTQVIFDLTTDVGSASGGPGFDYRLAVETLPSLDLAALPELLLGGTESQTLSGDKAQYGRVDEEIVMARKANGDPGFLEVEVTAYDVNAYATGILATLDPAAPADARIPQPLGIAQEGLVFSVPVPGGGLIVGHDNIVAQGFAQDAYSVTLRSAPELTEGVGFVSSMDDAPADDTGFSRDHFLIAPKGSLVEVTATGVGDGLTPILALFALDENQVQTLVACAGADGVANPAVCSIVADGEPLSVARYFPGDATETQILSVVMVDVASAEGTNFGFTLTPTLSNPTVIALDDTAGIDDLTQDVGGLDSQTGNTTRWAVVTLTPDVDPKTLDILSTPSAASTAVLTTTLYTQAVDGVFASGSDAAITAGGSTAVSTAAPAEPTTFLLKNALSGAPQSAANISVNASLSSIPVLSGANDLCAAPQVVAGSGSFVVDLFDTAANYTSTVRGPLSGLIAGGACDDVDGTGDGLPFGFPTSATAPESFFSVSIPAGATLSVDAGGTGNGDDTLVLVLNNTATVCADLAAANAAAVCLVGDDDTGGGASGYFSAASYANTGATPINALVIIKNWVTPNADGDANTVTFTIQ